MTTFKNIWDALTGSKLQKADEENTKASNELSAVISKLSREEQALGEIGAILKAGKQQND